MVFGAPNFSPRDIYDRNRGFFQIPTWRLYQEMLNTDLASLGTDFRVPIYFFQGTEDEVTAAALARDYFDKVNGIGGLVTKNWLHVSAVSSTITIGIPHRFHVEPLEPATLR
jgi:hypothetical protein